MCTQWHQLSQIKLYGGGDSLTIKLRDSPHEEPAAGGSGSAATFFPSEQGDSKVMHHVRGRLVYYRLQDLFLNIIPPVWFATVMTFINLAVCLTTPTQCIAHFDCAHAQCPTIWKLITQPTSTLHFAFITQSDICTSYRTNFRFYDSWIIVSLYNLKGMPCSPIVRYYIHSMIRLCG